LGKIRPKSRNEICFSTMTYLFYDDLSLSAIQAGPSGSRPLVGNSGGTVELLIQQPRPEASWTALTIFLKWQTPFALDQVKAIVE